MRGGNCAWEPSGSRRKHTSLDSHGLNIQHDDRDALLSEASHHGGTDPGCTARDKHNLSGPDIFVIDPIVAQLVRIPCAETSDHGKAEQHSQSSGCRGMQDGPILSFLGAPGE